MGVAWAVTWQLYVIRFANKAVWLSLLKFRKNGSEGSADCFEWQKRGDLCCEIRCKVLWKREKGAEKKGWMCCLFCSNPPALIYSGGRPNILERSTLYVRVAVPNRFFILSEQGSNNREWLSPFFLWLFFARASLRRNQGKVKQQDKQTFCGKEEKCS